MRSAPSPKEKQEQGEDHDPNLLGRAHLAATFFMADLLLFFLLPFFSQLQYLFTDSFGRLMQ